MKEELLAKLRQINPINEHGIPKNKGNCQWCAIEGARVLLGDDVQPSEIPSYSDGSDPIEERVHPRHGSDDVRTKNPEDFFQMIQALNKGDLMLVTHLTHQALLDSKN